MSRSSPAPGTRAAPKEAGPLRQRVGGRASIAVTITITCVLGLLAFTSSTDATPATAKPHAVFGSVSGSPHLRASFKREFQSRFVHANGIRQHAVIGGEGPPLLLVHGWPENWYAWRLMMPALARHFTVIAPDQRGIGLTQKTKAGYDSATLADDLAALMTKLGYHRYSVVGHDTGYIIAYALAADHRDQVKRLAVTEIPGPPGVGEDPSLFPPEPVNNKVWHIPFNRVNDELIVEMVHSNAEGFYGYEFAVQAGGATLPKYAIDYYIELYDRDRCTLRSSFGLYRAWLTHIDQNRQRSQRPLTIPVLGIGGENSWGARPGDAMTLVAANVRTVVIPGVGHWVAETAPQRMTRTLTSFLAPASPSS